jgi:hypothetical protein
MQRSTILFVLGTAVLLLTGCAATHISNILNDPSRFRDRLVHIDGTVVRSAGVMGNGAYEVEDGTGKIFVISASGVPRTGTRVAVAGTVINGVELMGRSFGTAIREREHRVKD